MLPTEGAAAQHTGGSFGGGSFGGSRSGGGGHYGGSHGGRYGSYGRLDAESCLTLGLTVIFVGFALMLSKGGRAALGLRPPGAPVRPYAAPEPRPIDVSALVIGLEASACSFVRRRLDDLVAGGDTSSTGGLHALLHETIALLRRAEPGWKYVGVVSTRPLTPVGALALFRKTSTDMSSRFPDAPERAAGAEPDEPRFAVVTVLVSAHRELPDVAAATDRKQLLKLVRAIGCMAPHDLVGLEIIWSPARADEFMSPAELETAFPELHRLSTRA